MTARTAAEPFRFYTRLILPEITGMKAENLIQLLEMTRIADPSSIYHHTHRFLQQHQYLSPEPPNDFAYWVTEIIGVRDLGEKLASIDTIDFSGIEGLRAKILETIEEYIGENPSSGSRTAHKGEEFYFIKSVSFIFPTEHVAHDLREFVSLLKKVTVDSLYFHIFEARLRLEKGNNDFSYWIGASLGEGDIAESISKLDPYTHTLENLRNAIVDIIEKNLRG
ncbi:MAG: DUF5752 family protein [Candidatus Omnitrophota bacterium]